MEFEFKGWGAFRAKRDMKAQRQWTKDVAKKSQSEFKFAMAGKKTGVLAKRRGTGGMFRRSAPDEFPAIDSGALMNSLKSTSNVNEAKVGTGMPYSKWLAEGTRYMAKRRMSKEALQLGKEETGQLFWVRWRAGSR